ncbi:hypothetical protein BDZ45DRAFT_459293 [Acephala macrosclerotiorum]|nr:hypothetical protein BDZ45DRAFT_459293 [Acephala macrosclerotiorum]
MHNCTNASSRVVDVTVLALLGFVLPSIVLESLASGVISTDTVMGQQSTHLACKWHALSRER